MKCSICKNNVEETFLGKPVGTYFSGKLVCRECQLLGVDYLRKKLK